MTTMNAVGPTYWQGYDAANRALDRSTLTAHDMLTQARAKESMYRREENHRLAEWNKGYADAVGEFLDDKGRECG